MEGYARQKVPGGKLLSVKVTYDDLIRKVQILGDFFIYPESALDAMERSLLGAPRGEEEGKLAERIRSAASSEKAELVGVTPEAIASTVRMAMR